MLLASYFLSFVELCCKQCLHTVQTLLQEFQDEGKKLTWFMSRVHLIAYGKLGDVVILMFAVAGTSTQG